MPKFKNILAQTPNVTTLIYMEDQLKQLDPTGYKAGVKIYKFSDVLKLGSESQLGKTTF